MVFDCSRFPSLCVSVFVVGEYSMQRGNRAFLRVPARRWQSPAFSLSQCSVLTKDFFCMNISA